MAKVLKSFEFRSAVGGGKYPWDEWLDGQIHQLDADDFGGTDAKYVAHQARNTAQRRNLKCRVSLNEKEQIVVLQATPMTDEEAEQNKAKLDVRKAEQKEKRLAKMQSNGFAQYEQEEEAPAPKKGKARKQHS